MTLPSCTTQRFEAVLEKSPDALGWTVVRVPFTPSKVWPEQVRLRVAGEINGFAFRSSLFAYPRRLAAASFCP